MFRFTYCNVAAQKRSVEFCPKLHTLIPLIRQLALRHKGLGMDKINPANQFHLKVLFARQHDVTTTMKNKAKQHNRAQPHLQCLSTCHAVMLQSLCTSHALA